MLKHLRRLGYKAKGWDPVHFPKTLRTKSDFVGCHYVINVIDRDEERRDTVLAAWNLARRAFVVSARLEHERDEAHLIPRGDGWITSKGTFQKFFSHHELGDLVSRWIGRRCDAVAPGVYVVFREEALRQEWKSRRMRTPSIPGSKTKSSRLLQEHIEVLEPMMGFVLERGRLPQGEELDEFAAVLETFR